LNIYGNVLRQAMKGTGVSKQQYEVIFGNEKLTFDNIGFAYLAIGKCTKVLNVLLANEAFVPSKNDFASFASACIHQNWHFGLNSFLNAFPMHVAFSSYDWKW